MEPYLNFVTICLLNPWSMFTIPYFPLICVMLVNSGGLCDNSVTHRILTLQKAALRLITFSEPRSPSAPIFAVLEILKFFDLAEVLNILLVHQHFSKVHHSFCTRGKSLGLPSSLNANTSKFGLKSKTVYIYILIFS